MLICSMYGKQGCFVLVKLAIRLFPLFLDQHPPVKQKDLVRAPQRQKHTVQYPFPIKLDLNYGHDLASTTLDTYFLINFP